MTEETNQTPPDLEGTNSSYADWAAIAIKAFQGATNADDADVLSDLLANLMHWADRNNCDFDKELSRAVRHYQSETSEVADSSNQPLTSVHVVEVKQVGEEVER